MPSIDPNKFKILARSSRLSSTEKNLVNNTLKEVQNLEAKIKTLEKEQKNEHALRNNPVVKKMLQEEAKKHQLEMAELKKETQQETRLKNNPKVQAIVNKEIGKLNTAHFKEKAKLQQDIEISKKRILDLENLLSANKTKPIQQKDFNQFLSNSIQDLQKSFKANSSEEDYEILIRDVDIEATVMTEMQQNKPVFIIPSRADIKELGGNNFQKLKYSLTIAPKDIDD